MPAHPEQRYLWTWNLESPPEALWPLVSDTDRFNRDCGYPSVTLIPPGPEELPRASNSRHLRASAAGVVVEWQELAFNWVTAKSYSVQRTYFRGPVASMDMRCDLESVGTGTKLTYEMRLVPANWVGRLVLPYVIGHRAHAMTAKVFHRYDEFAQQGLRASRLAQTPELVPGGATRVERLCEELSASAGQTPGLVDQLGRFIVTADDLSVAQMRPYALAESWRASRRNMLRMFLHATRAGLLDLSWDLICPHCRGTAAVQASLSDVSTRAHCDSCQVDFLTNFDQSVELTFKPNSAIRQVKRSTYCVGGPQVTPHIIAQRALRAGSQVMIPLALAPGRYRVRAPGVSEQQAFRVELEGEKELQLELGTVLSMEPVIMPHGELTVINPLDGEHLAVIESLAWSNDSVTATEVTAMQLFRDLFSQEVLRPGERISVGAMTVVFTDLKDSTQLYKSIGDAPAFGRVLTHFEVLKAAVAAEDGAIVKTMGDAIMAVFPHPDAALRAVLHAQAWLSRPEEFSFPAGVTVPPSSQHPLSLKAGIHTGPCLAINQNEHLDYFGTTVNIAARLCSLSRGEDIILSGAVQSDEEVSAHLASASESLLAQEERTTLKGFGDETYCIWRIKARRYDRA